MADEPEVIERDLAETRSHLTRTVDELARRADVAERARNAVPSSPAEAGASALNAVRRHQALAAGAGAGTVAVTVLAAWRRARSGHEG
jgi:hypothetical protein